MAPIIEKLGGLEAVIPVLSDRGLLKPGIKPNDQLFRRWRERGLPWPVKYALSMEARRRRIRCTEEDFEIVKEAA